MSTTTITSNEIFDHEIDAPSLTQETPRTRAEDRDRMLDYMIEESRQQRARERRREEQATATRRRRARGAVATGTVAIVIAIGGTLFFLEGPSHGPGPQSSDGTPAAAIQPASNGSQATPTSGGSSSSVPASTVTPAAANVTPAAAKITPSTPPPGPSGTNTGNMGTGPNTQIPSGNNTGNMGSNGGPLNGPVSQ